jgi:hypothetical protein
MGGNIGSEKGKFAESWQREWREEDDVRADNEHVGRKLPLLTAVLRYDITKHLSIFSAI